MGQPAPGEAIGTATPIPASQGYPVQQYPVYPPYPGPLTLPTAPLPVPIAYDIRQQEKPPVQATSPGPILVQLGASQNFLVNNRPARWIQVLDVDPSYQRARTPSPNRAPGKNDRNYPNYSPRLARIIADSLWFSNLALSVYVRAPETEVHYWAVFLRQLTVQEVIKRVVQKYGFTEEERDRVKMVVRVTDQGVRRLTDDDVRHMESEVAIDVKVTSLDGEGEDWDWQLELRY